VQALSAEIITLWAELGTPQAQTDSKIIECSRDAPEQLGLHADDVGRLKARRDKLVEEKRAREKRLRDIGTQIEQLWERLCIPEAEQREFLARNRGCGMRVINEFEDELGRLNELKKQNLGLFVEEARLRLQALWDGLYFSEEEMLQFTPAFSGTSLANAMSVSLTTKDVYSDALLAAHESEIARLEALQEQRAPILTLIDRHKSLIKERDDLTASSQDASRLMLRGQKGEKRDPTRLLREEKMRKRIAKELPKIEKDLQKMLEQWEDEYGRPFLVCGEQYLEELAAAQARGPPPPRSKTPSGHPPPSRSNSKGSNTAPKATTARDAPQQNLRSKTPTSFATVRGNPLSQSMASGMQRGGGGVGGGAQQRPPTSPSRIPAPRAPLTSTHGNNSPERRYKTLSAAAGKAAAAAMGPPRLPPPKMKDLFAPPPGTPHAGQQRQQQSGYEDRSGSIVRQVPPEDPYVDGARSRAGHHHHPQPSASTHHHASLSASVSAHDRYQQQHQQQQQQHGADAGRYEYSHAPAPPPGRGNDMRHTSATSAASSSAASTSSSLRSRGAPESVTTAASGSENWETYDEDDEDLGPAPRQQQVAGGGGHEPDAAEAYYARLRAQHGNKRASPDGGGGGWEKRARGNGPLAAREEWMEEEGRY
jgi:protein regulator of cytokinesis 1